MNTPYIAITIFALIVVQGVTAQNQLELGSDGLVYSLSNADSIHSPEIGQMIFDTSDHFTSLKVFQDTTWYEVALNESERIFSARSINIKRDEPFGFFPDEVAFFNGGLNLSMTDVTGAQHAHRIYQSTIDSTAFLLLTSDNPEDPISLFNADVAIGPYLPKNKLHIRTEKNLDGIRLDGGPDVNILNFQMRNSSENGGDYRIMVTGGQASLGRDKFVIRDAKRQVSRLEIDSTGDVRIEPSSESFLSIGPEAFQSTQPTDDPWIMNTQAPYYGGFINGSFDGSEYALAPVRLPDEAVVNRLVTYTFDSTSISDVVVTLIRQNLMLQSVDEMASTNSSATPLDDDGLYWLTDFNPDHVAIDNEKYRYFIKYSAANHPYLRLYSVQIGYFSRKLN